MLFELTRTENLLAGNELRTSMPHSTPMPQELEGDNQKSVCRATMRLLKWWIIRGMHTQSSDEHMKDVWSELLREASSGDLEEPPDRPPL